MDFAQAVTLAVQLTGIAVLAAMLVILVKAIQVEPVFRGRPGGALMKIIIGVVFGFTIAQAFAVLNVFGILALHSYEIPGLHNSLRLLQQVVIVVTCIWGWRMLARYL